MSTDAPSPASPAMPAAEPSGAPTVNLAEALGQPALSIRSGDGAQATVLLHGAQLVSWRPAGGEEQLFISPLSRPGQAARGGVPVIFPQFEARGPLPRHGFARNRPWQPVQRSQLPDHAMAMLRLVDDEATRAIWPHPFSCELTVSIGGSRLDIELAVTHTGQPDAPPLAFTAALHTYVRVGDLRQARLEGLSWKRFEDSVERRAALAQGRPEPALKVDDAPELQADGETDRIYFGAGQQALVLREPGRRLHLAADGLPDVVVWNPGADKAAELADLGEHWRQMLCVEAACIGQPVTLAPGAEWVGRQTLTAG